VKVIVDAQLPFSLSRFLNLAGHDSIHTIELPDQNNTIDESVLKISTEQNRIVITKDNDFLVSFLVQNRPQKLILIKTGNIKNSALIAIFEKHHERIAQLMEQNSLIEITKWEIIIHS
jgi:predicted nuclease of predicted toxin-antitoxin system